MSKRHNTCTVIAYLLIAAIAFAFLIVWAAFAHAENWVSSGDPANDAWYAGALRNNPNDPLGNWGSCCGPADAYWAGHYEVVDGEYFVTIMDDRDVPGRKPRDGARILIPKDKFDRLHQGTPPDGHVVVFIGANDFVFCFFPGTGA
jgi:hypothetical protein